MATRWETYPIELKGGLITNLGRLDQGVKAPGSATILQNFEPDVQGGYTRVLGFNKFSSTEVPGAGLIHGVIALSSSEALAERGGDYYYSSGTGWTSKLALTAPGITKFRGQEYNFSGTTKTVVVDGLNPPAYFDHSAKTMAYAVGAPAEVIGANRVRDFKSHLFFAKGPQLTFTAPYTDDSFSTANGAGTINVGDDIVGLTVFRNQLIVFCLNKILRVDGSTISDFTLSPITTNTGCLCGETVQEVGGDIMYLGPDGVRYLSASERENDFGLVRASEKIQKSVLNVLSTNCAYASVTLAGKNQYRLFYYLSNVPASGSQGFLATKYSNQTVEDISWSVLKGFKVYTLSKFQNRDSEVIFFSSDTGYIYRMESGNSLDGENIEAICETPYMPISDPKFRKTVYKHTLFAKPLGDMNLTCQIKFDYSQSGSSPSEPFEINGVSGTATYGSITAIYGSSVYGVRSEEQYYNNTVGSGFVLALRYFDSSQSPPFNINFVVLEYRQHERR